MKIGIVTNFIDEKAGGIATYTYNVIKYLNKVDSRNKYYLIHHTKNTARDIYKNNKEIIIPLLKIPFKITIWRYLQMPIFLKQHTDHLDILHDPFEIGLFTLNFNKIKIITIYDLSAYLYSSYHTKLNYLLHKLLMKRTVQRADFIITISKSSKREIVKYLQIPEEKIKVIYLSANDNFKLIKKKQLLEETKRKYNLPSKFILYVGTLEPRKNIPTLLKAYSEINLALRVPLVIVGKKGWKYEEIYKTLDTLNIQSEVIFLDYISDEDLPILYNLAYVFVYPSLYEGFGLPPLEAMKCGCPVITSNGSSLPEVVGDAGILIDPNDIKALTRAIVTVLQNDSLRKDLILRGLRKAKNFSWERNAKETLTVYEKLYKTK